MIKTVKLNSKEDVIRLNEIAANQPFDMSVSSRYTILDAKSLLALFDLVGKEVNIVAPDDVNPRYFEKIVKKMKLEAA